jgi:hypothetical protein
VHGNYLKASLAAAGLDPGNLPVADKTKMNFGSGGNMKAKAWRDIWGSGQGVRSIDDVPAVAEVVARLVGDHQTALAGSMPCAFPRPAWRAPRRERPLRSPPAPLRRAAVLRGSDRRRDLLDPRPPLERSQFRRLRTVSGDNRPSKRASNIAASAAMRICSPTDARCCARPPPAPDARTSSATR